MEGGQATLLVAPSGESLLVDAGWPGFDGRDAERIASAARRAGLERIDYMLVTHYHRDHVGGVPPLAARIPIGHYVDHGPNTETGQPKTEALARAYYKVRDQSDHVIVKPGDRIPIQGLDVVVVAARGEVIDRPLPGAGAPNPACSAASRKAPDSSENGKSVGIVVTYGDFRFIDLGDLTWNFELSLACPVNKIGEVDVYLTTHHGLAQSGAPALVHALNPRVAIMNNGARKGCAPAAWRVVNESPRLEAFWQLHYKLGVGESANVPDHYIANLADHGHGYGLKLSAKPDGSFTVTNERNGYTESYRKKRRE